MAAPRIELLYFENCPNHEQLLPHLRSLLQTVGVDEPVVLRAIEDAVTAERERFLGSPTVRVHGRDVEPGADERRDYGLKCRLYRTRDGLRGAPPDEWVLAALRADATA